MNLVIDAQGGIACIYGEAIPLHELGPLVIRRGSHVEPDGEGRWWADLAPVGGPVLGPFDKRSQALDTEITWLERHWLPSADSVQATESKSAIQTGLPVSA